MKTFDKKNEHFECMKFSHNFPGVENSGDGEISWNACS